MDEMPDHVNLSSMKMQHCNKYGTLPALPAVHCLHENTNMVSIILVYFCLFMLVKELFHQLPQQRKLTNEEKEKAK